MNIEKLVPPIQLCKLIPKGEFADSALCWVDTGHSCVLPDCETPPEQPPFVELRRYTIQGDDDIPAPTLEEIIRKIRLDLLCGIEHHGDFYVSNRHIGCFEDERATTAALKLWFEVKGTEYNYENKN